MKAIQFDRLGGPEVLEPREVPLPELAPGDVLVRNRAIAVNFGDLFFIDGRYLVKPVFPDVPGMEAAGVIEAVGPRVDGLTPGMRVMSLRLATGDGDPPGFARSLLRLLGLLLAIIPMFLGFLPALVDDRRRALQDFMAGTAVVKTASRAPAESDAPLGEPTPVARAQPQSGG